MEESYEDVEDSIFELAGLLARAKGVGVTELNTAIPAYNRGYVMTSNLIDLGKMFKEWISAPTTPNQNVM